MPTKEALLQRLRLEIVISADFIRANPHKFKVCEGCERAIAANNGVCPVCHSYRFDNSPSRVLERASFRQDKVENFYATLPRF